MFSELLLPVNASCIDSLLSDLIGRIIRRIELTLWNYLNNEHTFGKASNNPNVLITTVYERNSFQFKFNLVYSHCL